MKQNRSRFIRQLCTKLYRFRRDKLIKNQTKYPLEGKPNKFKQSLPRSKTTIDRISCDSLLADTLISSSYRVRRHDTMYLRKTG